MNLNIQTIFYTSIFFWLLPAIRHYKKKYFFYFLILALSDPVNILYVRLIGYPLYITYSVAGFALFFAITSGNNKNKNLFTYPTLALLLILGTIYIKNLLYLVLIFHFLILLTFIKTSILSIYLENQVNLFYVALVFYELSVVLNIAMVLGDSDIKVIIFFITLSFQILLAIFFTFFTEKSASLNIHLRQAK
jgi:hypothetical protein